MKIHPNDTLLLEAFDGLSREQRRPVLEHLERCARCRDRLKELHRWRSSPLSRKIAGLSGTPGSLSEYDSVLDRALKRFRSRQVIYERERSEAVDLLPRLMEESPEHRELRLRNDPRFQTWGFLELLLKEATQTTQKAPESGEDPARLCLVLADHLDGEFYGRERIADLRARAWSVIGNVRRLRSEVPKATEAFSTAERHLHKGTGDPMEWATLSDLKASLLRSQSRFADAMRLLKRVLDVYTKAEDHHSAGKTLLGMDGVHFSAGRPTDGVPLLHQALKLLAPLREPSLLPVVWHNLANDLAKSGKFMEARGAILRAHPLYAQYPGYPDRALVSKGLWVEGRIALGLGQFREAEALLLKARDGVASFGLASDATLIEEEMRASRAALDQERSRRRRRLASEGSSRLS